MSSCSRRTRATCRRTPRVRTRGWASMALIANCSASLLTVGRTSAPGTGPAGWHRSRCRPARPAAGPAAPSCTARAGRQATNLLAVGERHHPRVQEHAGGVGHRELAVLCRTSPGTRRPAPRTRPRIPRRGRRGGPAAPVSRPARGQARSGSAGTPRTRRSAAALSPDDRGQPEQQAREQACRPGRPGRPQQQRDRRHGKEKEQRVRHDQVLELDLEPVVEHRQAMTAATHAGAPNRCLASA